MTGASKFNEQMFEEKLVGLKDTQDAISAMSGWCLKHKEYHKKIVACWLHCLKRVKIDVRLSLFYLANDVIQYSKRKHLPFVDSWATALQKATPLVRDDKVRNKILRIFKIWQDRSIYDETFISDLGGLLTTTVKKKSEQAEQTDDDFQPSTLVHRIKAMKALGDNTDSKFKRIKDNKLPLADAERMRQCLKDRRNSGDLQTEVDNGVKKMEAFVKALESEINCREKLLELLRQAVLYYENQRGEAKVIAYAYKKFGNHLKARSKTVEEVLANLGSPVPSPDVNAPSPSPDSDLESKAAKAAALHAAAQQSEYSLVNSSFIGSADFLSSAKDVFSGEPVASSQAAEFSQPQAIEVIGTNSTAPTFDVAEFFKSLMPAKEPAVAAPPLPHPPMPMHTEWSASGPWDLPPPDTPQSPPHYDKVSQVTHLPIEYDDTIPVPPVPDVDHRTLIPPPLDVDHRVPPPGMTAQPPPGMTSQPPPGMTSQPPPGMTSQPPPGMTSQPPPGMTSLPPPLPNISLPNIEMPVRSERGALIAPTPGGILIPPLPPPAVVALLDVDQRNLISLTGSPTAPSQDLFRKEESSYVPKRNPYTNEVQVNQPPYTPPKFTQPDRFPSTEYTPESYQKNNSHNWRSADEPRANDNVESIDMDVSDGEDESQRIGMGNVSQDFGVVGLLGPPPPPPVPGPGPSPGPKPFHGRPGGPQGRPSFGFNTSQEPVYEEMMSSSAGAKLIPPDHAEEMEPVDENGSYDYEEYPDNSYPANNFSNDYPEEYEEPYQEDYQENYEENFQEEYYHKEAPVRRGRWNVPRGGPRGAGGPRGRGGFPRGAPRGGFPFRAPRRGFFRPRGRARW